MNELTNYATADGLYNGLETNIQSNENTILLINNLEVKKKSNKTLWATNNLIYTLTIKNLSSTLLTNIIIADILDHNLVSLVVESVRINDVPAGYGVFTYNKDNGELIINLPNIGANETVVINYQVRKNMREVFKINNVAVLSFDNSVLKTKANNIVQSNTVTVYGISSICRCREK